MSGTSLEPTTGHFRFAALLAAALTGALGVGAPASAFGQSDFGQGAAPYRLAHWGDHHGRGPIDRERAQAHAERMARHVAWAVDATPAQRRKLIAIARTTADDVVPLFKRMRAVRARAVELLRG